MDDKRALDNSMCTSMGTAVTMAMDVPLSLLDLVDLFGNCVDIVLFVVRDLLYTFRVPADVVASREVLLLDIVGVLVGSFMDSQFGSTIDGYSSRHDDCARGRIQAPVLKDLPRRRQIYIVRVSGLDQRRGCRLEDGDVQQVRQERSISSMLADYECLVFDIAEEFPPMVAVFEGFSDQRDMSGHTERRD